MEVILIGEGWSRRITPLLGVKVEADHKIGSDTRVDQRGATADLSDPVKEALRFVLKSLARQRNTLILKGGNGRLLEVSRPKGCRRAILCAGHPDLGPHRLQALLEQLGNDQRHLPLGDGSTVPDPKPACLHLRIAAAEVTWVDCDP